MKIHFIAIGGSVMHQLAIALHNKGYAISGSDDEIFDPAASNLQKYDIFPKKLGWHPEKITKNLDAVILGMHARKNNPELLAAQQLNIPIYSFPEYIYEQSKNKKRVVIGGSHGKTSITAMIMHVLQYWDYEFDYLVGAKLAGFDYSVKITDAPIIILEGDEYLTSPLHPVPKFHCYHPNIALLSGIAWDHINVFPTFENYVSQFKIFAAGIEAEQTLIYNKEDDLLKEIAQEASHLKTIAYHSPDYTTEDGRFNLLWNSQKIPLQIFGKHNLQNLEGARLVCRQLGVSDPQFFAAIRKFKGAARRLELVGENEHCAVYRDFAHAPSKVKATTNALNELHPGRQLIACLELHTYSSLNKAFLPQYAHALSAAQQAIVYFDAHTFAIKKLPPLSPSDVIAAFDHPNLQVFTQADELFAHLNGINWQYTDLLMMSSGNFGGINMKDITTFALSQQPAKKQRMLQLKRPLAVFDLETTGVNLATDRIVEISILKIMPDGQQIVRTQRINPTIPIPEQTSLIHGIYDDDVKDAPTFADIAKDLFEFLKDCDVAGFNSNYFDVPVLMEEFLRLDMVFADENRRSVDVFKIFQRKEPRNLGAALKFYCNKELVNAHSAEADVRATYDVLVAQIQKYEDLENNVDFLHNFTQDATKYIDSGRRMIEDEKGIARFNFGKHRNKPVTEVLRREPQYYDWIQRSNFLRDTKQKLKAIKEKM